MEEPKNEGLRGESIKALEVAGSPANLIPSHGEGIQAIIDLADNAAGYELLVMPTKGLGDGLPENVPLLVDRRPGGKVESIKKQIEDYRLTPERRKGTATVTTLQSFIALTNRHKDEGSAIFGKTSWPEPKLTAVIDYHDEANAPRRCEHRIVYSFPLTDEIKTWIDLNGKMMEQSDFAAFLEEHAAELASPFDGETSEYERLFKERFSNPIELINLSRHLEVHVGAKVKRAERLQTGERTVEFVEEHLNGAGEKVDIPGIFMVSVRAFMDGEPVRIPARLRYRLSGGTIKWFYQLYRWEFFLRERVQADLEEAGKETGLPVFEGQPEQ
ncbi:uncharacterized protein YfdQ (DUF2303 family) [Microvirga flocculans]|uniref:Uncharacterized protein YfdQ (DUF2303 family) n=1 Tax=Microvirga flocculans TaxID=217168 RepID=A0A7W6NA14_9HYPH|nr:DUF2303 family protein [Microvirga flocculans]MBB4042045.1 uncharacterized protein YfdQ (DUF2303 family) [Microvirga flocculans]